jgi:hypothetical protein
MDGALAGTVRQENGAIDVEENELHGRVSNKPLMMETAPRICQGVGVS